MRIEDLNMFISIAKYRSISEAARREHFTQPAVSAMLHSMEKQLGVKLVERRERQRQLLVLTPEGETVLRHAERIVSEYQEMALDIAGRSISDEPFTVGCGRSFSVLIMPALVGNFKKKYPNIPLEMRTYLNTRLALMDMGTELDMTLSSVPARAPGLIYEKLMDDPFLLACPPDMDMPEEISMHQMKKLPFIMRERESFTYEQVRMALNKRGVNIEDLNVIMTVHDNAAVKQAIEMGNGCGFVPWSAVTNVKMKHRDIRIVHVKGFEIMRSIYLVRRENQPLSGNRQLFWAYALSGKWYRDLFVHEPPVM